MRYKIFASALALLAASCAPTISNFDEYQKQFLTKSSFLPTAENLDGKPQKVVVFALDENSNDVATQAGLGTSIANNVENVLSQNKLAELIDRKASGKLQKEIALSEMNKTGSYKGPKVADYAISGSISNAGFTSKYSSGSTIVNPKTGYVTSIPPRFSYASEVSGNLKIYELPSLTVAENIEFTGKSARSENVQNNGGINLFGIKAGGKDSEGAKRDDSLVRKAASDAIDNARIAIKNFFAKKGYILEKRVYKNKSIFKISLGSSDGVEQGDKLEIIGQYETENSITGQSETEKRIITTAKISDKIDMKTSWIIIDDLAKADKIRLGDMVKVKYSKSFSDKLKPLASLF